MRAIGMAERAYELMCHRALTRVAFGKELGRHGMAQEAIALSRIAIDQARLLVLDAAHTIDKLGNRAARTKVAMVKVAVPRAVQEVMEKGKLGCMLLCKKTACQGILDTYCARVYGMELVCAVVLFSDSIGTVVTRVH